MASYMARNHPLAPARRGHVASVGESCAITFRWADGPATARDGRTIALPKYGGEAVTPPAPPAESNPSPPQSPVRRGPPPQVRQLWAASKAKERGSRGGRR
jgi:hypothetical protein